jgi:hypothetical protein
MTWDAANGRLGIGTSSPAYLLDISGTSRQTGIYYNTGYNIFVQRLGFNNGTIAANYGYIRAESNGVFSLRNASENDFTRLQFGGSTSSFPALQRVSNAIAIVDGTGSGTSNLLIGSTTDSGERLQVTGTMKVSLNQNAQTFLNISNSTSGTSSSVALNLNSSNGGGSVFKNSATSTTYKISAANDYGFYNGTSGDIAFLNDVATGNIKFAAGGVSTAQMTLHNTGNLLLGSTTNSGERLQVTGTMKVTGDATISGFIFTSTNPNRPWIAAVNGFASPNSNGTALQLNIDNSSSRTTTGFDFLIRSGTRDYTSGSVDVIRLTANFTPTSGTGVFSNFVMNPTINQTGGANGITRGLYVNPTLTAAADFRAIETTNGKVIFGNLPTSPVGLPTGAIWNNLGMINIV